MNYLNTPAPHTRPLLDDIGALERAREILRSHALLDDAGERAFAVALKALRAALARREVGR